MRSSRSVSDARSNVLLNEALTLTNYDGDFSKVVLVATMGDKFNISQESRNLKSDELKELKIQLSRAEGRLEREQARLEALEEDKNCSEAKRLDSEIGRWTRARTAANKDPNQHAPVVGQDPKKKVFSLAKIKAKIDELREQKRTADTAARRVASDLKEQRDTVSHVAEKVASRQAALEAYIFGTCMEVIKRDLKDNFVAEIRVRDESLANMAHADGLYVGEGIITAQDLLTRNYKQVKARLPVFVVSSQAFKNLTHLGEKAATEFAITNVEHTGMPALAAHMYKVAADAHHKLLHSKKNMVDSAYGSLLIDINEDTEAKPVNPEKASAALQLAGYTLDAFLPQLPTLAKEVFVTFRPKYDSYMSKRIKLKGAIAKTAQTELEQYGIATRTSTSLCYQEMRATIVRNGIWQTVTRKLNIDFNRIVKTAFDNRNETAMNRLFVVEDNEDSAKTALTSCFKKSMQVVEVLKAELYKHALNAGVSSSAQVHLERQYDRRRKTIRDIFHEARQEVGKTYITAVEDLKEHIKEAWSTGYKEASEVSGRGATEEMLDIIIEKLLNGSTPDDVAKGVLGALDKPIKDWDKRMRAHINVIETNLEVDLARLAKSMVSDYQSAFEQREGYSKSSKTPAFERIRQMLLGRGEDIGILPHEADDSDNEETDNGDENDEVEISSRSRKRKRDIMESPDAEMTDDTDIDMDRAEETEDSEVEDEDEDSP